VANPARIKSPASRQTAEVQSLLCKNSGAFTRAFHEGAAESWVGAAFGQKSFRCFLQFLTSTGWVIFTALFLLNQFTYMVI